MAPITSVDTCLPASSVEQRKAVLEVCMVWKCLEGYLIPNSDFYNKKWCSCSTYDRKAHLPNRLPNISPA